MGASQRLAREQPWRPPGGGAGEEGPIPALVYLTSPQESLRLQEQAALDTEDGEGLQQTLRDLAQVRGGREPREAGRVRRGPWAGSARRSGLPAASSTGLALNCKRVGGLRTPGGCSASLLAQWPLPPGTSGCAGRHSTFQGHM